MQVRFKPCYKWITFNTSDAVVEQAEREQVLNLVINGLPSIPIRVDKLEHYQTQYCFKPCYKWITFNTMGLVDESGKTLKVVLNLVINGLPSILCIIPNSSFLFLSFKPCYKWITFNTLLYIQIHLCILCFKPCYKWITFNTVIQ